MVVVVVQPVAELATALRLGDVAAGVGQGAVEQFDLAVGLRPVRAGALVLDAELVAGVAPQV